MLDPRLRALLRVIYWGRSTHPMQKLAELKQLQSERSPALLPVTVIVAVRNEARNLPCCLESLRDAGEVYVVDSQSTDGTVEIASSFGARIVQFHYQGGWPKKRQWAIDSVPFAYDWILLVDADEALTPEQHARRLASTSSHVRAPKRRRRFGASSRTLHYCARHGERSLQFFSAAVAQAVVLSVWQRLHALGWFASIMCA